MPRFERPLPRKPAPSAPALQLARRLWAWLWPRLEELGCAWRDRAVAFVESGEARDFARACLQRARSALRKARRNDTVPAGTVRQALGRYEERMIRAEKRRAEREQRRLLQEAKRKTREERYREKSSIYLG